MAAYKDLVGQKITVVTSNPPEPKTGQMWYNSTDGKLRGLGIVEAFTSQTNMPTATGYHTSFGQAIPTTVSAGGIGSPGPAPTSAVFEFNGSGWTAGGALPSSGKESPRGFGTQTAGVIAGGSPGANPDGSTTTSHYNGSSWTSGGALPTAVQGSHTFGTQTAGFLTGGRGNGPPFPKESASYTYNGTAWTNSTAMPQGRQFGASSSTSPQTSALVFSGQIPPGRTNSSIEWNGSAWTSTPNVTFTADNLSGSGIATAALAASGSAPSVTGSSSKYDGSSWTAGATLSTARSATSGQGATGVTSIIFGGLTPSYTTAVEEYNFSTNTVTAAAWAAGGTVPYTSRQNMSFGTQTAAIACGGYVSGNLNTSISYDGTSYSSTPNLNAAARIGGVAGTQSAGLEYGGIQPPGTYVANMQSWNGSSWSNSPYNLNNGTYGMMSCGTSTSALSAGGENPSGGDAWNITEEYDGEGWTSGNTMPAARYYGGGDGTQTSAFIAGGSGPVSPTTLEYDGTNWTAGGGLISPTGAGSAASGENSDSGLIFGGSPPGSGTAITQGYDGTAWSTRPSLGTGRGFTTGNGTTTAALMVSGGPPSGTSTATEEFTGQTSSANITDFSTEA